VGPEPGAELIDLYDGRRDLQDKLLHVLHGRSFIDDPTRILRGVRLEQRLGFRLSPDTLELVEDALAERVFDLLSGSRLREELILLLGDPALALGGVERLAELGVLRAIDPRLELDEATRERLGEALAALDGYRREAIADPPVAAWRLFLLALAAGLEPPDRERLAGRLLLDGEDRRLLTASPPRLDAARAVLQDNPAPHQAAEALEPLAGEELLLLMAEGNETVRAWVSRYLTGMRPLTLSLRGADLLAAGVPPGPRIGEALRATRRARLDGRVDAAEELRYALDIAKGES
jgi:tRNA nucleotidyltransferase (CCA-adding enzyme)